MKEKKPHLKFWQRTYLSILALFLVCLTAVCGIAYQLARRQSYEARVRELLNQQHYILLSMAQDLSVLTARNTAALPALYAYYADRYAADGLYLEVFQNGEAVYTSVVPRCAATGARPELSAATGERIYLVRHTEAGRRLFAATALSDTLSGTTLVFDTDMEAFYLQWENTARLFLLAGGAISIVFALALYAVLRRLYQPLKVVTETANRLAAGERDARAPVTRKDEFGELAASLNGMADTVNRQMSELQTVAEQRERLIENLSHEIRTPLAAISGWAATLRGANLSEAEQADALDTILFESNRILSLSKQMLELSVLQHDAAPEVSAVCVKELLLRTEAVLRPKAALRKVCFSVSLPPAFETVTGNGVLLESVLVNLCDNAVKACAAGGNARLSTERHADGTLCFLVKDDGHGMKPETLQNLGQPFYREDKSRSRREGGAGLGVSLCMEIARKHGGTLTYQGAPGRGTLAVLALPQGGTPEMTTSTQNRDTSVTIRP